MWWHGDLGRREIQDGANSCTHEAIDDTLRIIGRNGEHRDGRVFPLNVLREVGHVSHDRLTPWLADLVGIVVVDANDPESALVEATVIGQRRAELPGTDDDHLPLALEAENFPKVRRHFVDGVPQATLTEGPEERQILAYLCRGGSAEMREFVTGGRVLALSVEIFEVPEVRRKASDGRFGDAFHGRVGVL